MKLFKGFFAASHTNRGNILFMKGLLDEAIEEYREALRLKPKSADAHYNLGGALANKGLYDEAIEEYKEALHLKPDLAEVHSLLGAALHCKGLIDEAIRELRAALMLSPNSAEAHCSLGRALFDKGLVDEAIKEHREASCLKPEFPEAHFDLGIFLIHKGLIDEGITEIRGALRLEPGFVDAHSNDVFYTAHRGQIDEAIKKIKEGTTQSIDDLSNLRLAHKTMKASDKPDEDFSMHLLALNPHDGSGPFAVRAVNSAEMSLPAVTIDGRISYLPVGSDINSYQELLADVRFRLAQIPKETMCPICVGVCFSKPMTAFRGSVLIYDVVGVPKDMQERLSSIYESLINLRVVGDTEYVGTEKLFQSEPMKSWINQFLEDLKQKLNWSEYVKRTLDSYEK